MDILTQTLIIGGTGLVCAIILAVAARYLLVHEDPRIEAVTAMLPGINCGTCGFAGCSEYARGVVKEHLAVNLCRPGGAETVAKIAAFMGVEAVVGERQVACVLCQGDNTHAKRLAAYDGIADCAAAELVGGAGKGCRFGCLGFGTCSRICPVNAIELANGLAVVHPALCIGCGRCVSACPRKLIKLVPESRELHVLCMSQDRGPDVKRVCDVGCIGCALCVKTLNGPGIRMENNLAVVDYTVPIHNDDVAAKCPAHTIVRRTGMKQATS